MRRNHAALIAPEFLSWRRTMQIAEVQAELLADVTNGLECYIAPRIEAVLTPEDVEREVHYAGNIISCPGGNCTPT